MPPCHVQVKTPNFFSASTPQNKKDLVGFCDTSGNCNTDWILFLSVLEGLGSMRVKLLILSVFLAKLGDFGWESESLSGDADLVEQDLIPGQSAASVLQSVTVLQCVAECYSVTVCYRVLQPECCQCYTDSYPPDYFYPENGKFKIWEHCCLQTGTNHHFKQFLQNINCRFGQNSIKKRAKFYKFCITKNFHFHPLLLILFWTYRRAVFYMMRP